MGLDMYFEAEKHEFKSFCKWTDEPVDATVAIYPDSLKDLENYIEMINFKSKTITESYQIGYFRKFNALHNYIVSVFADGEDNCQKIYLTKADIEKLRDVCSLVANNHSVAEELLPTQSGFFFGSTEYDDWYFKDVEEAVKLFTLILDTVDFSEWSIVYNASW